MSTSVKLMDEQPDHGHSSVSADADAQRAGRRRKSPMKSVIVALVVMILGLGVLLYPVIATQVNNYRQQQVAEQYADAVTVLDTGQREALLERAEVYNRSVLGAPTHDPWQRSENYNAPEFREYLNQLNADRIGKEDAPVSLGLTSTMSQVIIPKINVNLPVFHGTGKEALDQGVGHLYGTSLPVGGPSTHSVLTGHTGITRATLFDNLTEVKEGDSFYLNTWGRKMKYQVDQIRVVLPENTEDLELIQDKDLVTLITCTPYGINDHRLLVRGHRVPMDPEEEKEVFTKQGLRWQWWMYAIIAASVVVIALVAWCIWRMRRRNRTAQK